jgi:hypothetical protein
MSRASLKVVEVVGILIVGVVMHWPLWAEAQSVTLQSSRLLKPAAQPNRGSNPPAAAASTDELFERQQEMRSLEQERWTQRQQQMQQRQDLNFQRQYQRQQREIEQYQNLKIRGMELR